MGKLYDVDFINKSGFHVPCLRPGFVYTTILCVVYLFFTVPKSNDNFSIPRLSSKECALT